MVSKTDYKKWNRWAITGFILSFLSFLAIFGIIFCAISLSQIKMKNQRGKKLAIAGIIIGCLIFILSITSTSLSPPYNQQTTQVQLAEKDYLIINGGKPTLNELYNYFFNSGYTDMQKKSIFNTQFKDKYVIWEVYVNDIDDDSWYTEYNLMGLMRLPSMYQIGSDVEVSFQKEEIPKLISFRKGSLIKFEGRLADYGGIVGDIFYVKDAVIIR